MICSRLVLAAACAMLAPICALAQQAAAEISSPNHVYPIGATPTADLSFGTLQRGSSATIASSSFSTGSVVVSGDASANVTITLPSSVAMITVSGVGGTMVAIVDRGSIRYGTKNTLSTAMSIDASSGTVSVALSSDDGGDGLIDGKGQAYIWMGGSVSASPTQQRGSYAGTFGVTATYAN